MRARFLCVPQDRIVSRSLCLGKRRTGGSRHRGWRRAEHRDPLAARQLSRRPAGARPERHAGGGHLLRQSAAAGPRATKCWSSIVPDGSQRRQLAQRGDAGARAGRRHNPPTARPAHSWGSSTFKARRYAEAEEHFKSASGQPDRRADEHAGAGLDLSGAEQDPGSTRAARRAEAPEWAQYYPALSSRAACRVAGRTRDARAAYERIPKNDQRTLRITLAYASHAGQCRRCKAGAEHAQRASRARERRRASNVRALQEQIEAGKRPDLLVRTPAEGMSEAFYGLGEALSGEGGLAVGVVSCSSRSIWHRIPCSRW